jgi:hypothetical protein
VYVCVYVYVCVPRALRWRAHVLVWFSLVYDLPPRRASRAAFASGMSTRAAAKPASPVTRSCQPAGAGSDCRWYIYSPGAGAIYLNMQIHMSGPDSQVLIYQGAETQTFMHEDVLNAAVCAPAPRLLPPPNLRCPAPLRSLAYLHC